ncbi:hypothetical protein [Sphingobacterium paucimobilis]|nr:hypothetical protein [Sphingobacterium paucimobilis]
MKAKVANIHVLLWIGLVVSICLTNCRKPLLPGPMGTQGEKGEPGDQGTDGNKGDPGKGGGLGNVYYSDWKYYDFTSLNTGYWRATVSEPVISNEILTKGTTIVYFKRDGQVFKTDYLTDSESLTQRLELGQIWLYSSWDPSSTMFRYIIIPPSKTIAAKAIQAKSKSTGQAYVELCEMLKIEL